MPKFRLRNARLDLFLCHAELKAEQLRRGGGQFDQFFCALGRRSLGQQEE
jgi:hypothetical protein